MSGKRMAEKPETSGASATKRGAGRPEKPLIIPGNWKDAVQQAMAKGKPPAPKKRSKKAAKKKPRPEE